MAFTERQATAEHWAGKDRLVSAGDGLYLNVRRSSKTWIIRRTHKGQLRVRTLGKYPTLSVKEARALALADALDKTPSNMTMGDLAERYFSEVVAVEQRRPEFFRGYLDRAVIPDLGARRVVELTPSDVAAVVQSYRPRGARAADALRAALRTLFAYAVEIGVRADNPAAILTRRVAGYRPEPRARVLTDEEIRRVWRIDHEAGRMLRFLLLTGLRISEAQKGLQDGDRWRVSARLSKNGKPHWVKLTPTALAQLPLSMCGITAVQSWVRRWCERENIAPRFTPHDLRRTSATRMAAAGVEPFIVERALNHTLQGVMGTYNRAEYEAERIAAAETLERELLAVVYAGEE